MEEEYKKKLQELEHLNMELANKGIALERTSNDSKNAIGPRNKNNKKPKILTVCPPVSPLGEDDMSFLSFSDESRNRKHPHNGTLEDVQQVLDNVAAGIEQDIAGFGEATGGLLPATAGDQTVPFPTYFTPPTTPGNIPPQSFQNQVNPIPDDSSSKSSRNKGDESSMQSRRSLRSRRTLSYKT